MTTGRVRSLVGVAIALIGLVIGVIAWRRAKTGNGRIGAAIALVLGLIGLVLSVLHIAASTGFGTGGGRAGAIVSLVLAVIAIVFAGLAFTRMSKTVTTE